MSKPTQTRQNSHKVINLNDVWSSLLTIQNSISSHDTKLKAVVSNIKSLERSLKSFSTVVENLSAELILAKEERAVLTSVVKSLEEKASSLKMLLGVLHPILSGTFSMRLMIKC